MSKRDPVILGLVIIILLGACLAGHYLKTPIVIRHATLAIPMTIAGWQGRDIPHTAGELGVLGKVDLIKREYRHSGKLIWLIAHQTPAVSRLHNVYVSLIASGAEPAVKGQKIIATRNGNLHVSEIRMNNTQGLPYEGYLWYQWRDGQQTIHNAPNRWRWYVQVLKARLNNEVPSWRLVEIMTPAEPSPKDTQRLDAFAKAFYELPDNSSKN